MSKNKPIYINLKRYYNHILPEVNREEYRALTQYWLKRLTGEYLYHDVTGEKLDDKELAYTLSNFADSLNLKFKDFRQVLFSNGYRKDRRQKLIELQKIDIGTGKPEWGAAPDTAYFRLHLGECLHQNY